MSNPLVIEVRLHTILQRRSPEGPERQIEVNLPLGSTLLDLLGHLNVELNPDVLLLVVNGRLVDLQHELNHGDKVNLMPAISGGNL